MNRIKQLCNESIGILCAVFALLALWLHDKETATVWAILAVAFRPGSRT